MSVSSVRAASRLQVPTALCEIPVVLREDASIQDYRDRIAHATQKSSVSANVETMLDHVIEQVPILRSKFVRATGKKSFSYRVHVYTVESFGLVGLSCTYEELGTALANYGLSIYGGPAEVGLGLFTLDTVPCISKCFTLLTHPVRVGSVQKLFDFNFCQNQRLIDCVTSAGRQPPKLWKDDLIGIVTKEHS